MSKARTVETVRAFSYKIKPAPSMRKGRAFFMLMVLTANDL